MSTSKNLSVYRGKQRETRCMSVINRRHFTTQFPGVKTDVCMEQLLCSRPDGSTMGSDQMELSWKPLGNMCNDKGSKPKATNHGPSKVRLSKYPILAWANRGRIQAQRSAQFQEATLSLNICCTILPTSYQFQTSLMPHQPAQSQTYPRVRLTTLTSRVRSALWHILVLGWSTIRLTLQSNFPNQMIQPQSPADPPPKLVSAY